jgi:hypothetical protein
MDLLMELTMLALNYSGTNLSRSLGPLNPISSPHTAQKDLLPQMRVVHFSVEITASYVIVLSN